MESSQLILAAAPLATLGALLSVLSVIDIVNRDSEEIAGSKWAWGLALLAIPVGPVAYLWFGRKKKPPAG